MSAHGWGIELPPGPAQRAWTAKENTEPARLDKEHERFIGKPDVWRQPSAWIEWAAALEAAARDEKPDGSRRAQLALMAWSQGRSDDAWDHLATLTDAHEWYTAAIPYLFPGNTKTGMGWNAGSNVGSSLEVDDGGAFAPAFPPPSVPACEIVLGTGRIERRAMKISGLRIGEALVDMRVALEYEGLQIDVEHKGGAACKLKLRLPVPLDFDIANVYVDWQRREGPTSAEVDVALVAGGEPVTIFARFEPLEVRWPTTVPSVLATAAREHGFALIVGDDDPERARVAGFAAAMARLLGCKTQVVAPAQALAVAPAITLDLSGGADRERKLRGLISQCERFALARKKP